MEEVEVMVVMGEGMLVFLLVNVVVVEVVVEEGGVEVEYVAFFFCFCFVSPHLLGADSTHPPTNILVSVMNSF